MKHYFKLHFPSYFGVPKATDIDAVALANAQSHMSQLLIERDLLEGLIQGYQLTIDRLLKP